MDSVRASLRSVAAMITAATLSVGHASALQLQLPLLTLVMMTESCSGLYGDQRVVLSRGVRGYISCPALAEPPATLIVWTKNGQVCAHSVVHYSWNLQETLSA